MDVKWSGDYISVVSPENYQYEAIQASDSVIALPVVDGEYVIRKEPLPAYMIQGDQERYWTVVSGGVEDGEKPLQTLKREVEEETGIQLERIKVLDRKEQIPYVKHSAQRVSFYFFEVLEHEEVEPQGDGTELEEQSEVHRVSIDELRNLSNEENADFLLHFALKCALNRENNT